VSSSLIIRTCHRPWYLQRLLTSLARRDRDDGGQTVVLDDSRLPGIAERNQAVVVRAGRRLAGGAVYLGESWQRAFIDRLCGEFPDDAAAIAWLLAPRPAGSHTPGRLINLAMLHSAGTRINLADDDLVLDQARQAPSTDLLHADVRKGAEWNVAGFPSLRASRMAGEVANFDPIERHRKLLGLRIEDCVTPAGELVLDPEARANLDALREHGLGLRSRILTTGHGIFGRPIDPTGYFIFTQAYRCGRPPWQVPSAYPDLRRGLAMWKSAHRHTFTARAGATPGGVDNRQLTPPTIPVCHGEDTLFCILLKFIHPDAAHLEFPWAVGHFRGARSWITPTFHTAGPLTLANVLGKFVDDESKGYPQSGSPQERMKDMGQALLAWGSRPHPDILRDVLARRVRIVKWRIKALQRWLEPAGDEHPQFRIDLLRCIAIHQNRLAHLDRLPPFDEAACPPGEAASIAWLAGEARAYGQALQAWPRLWAYCASQAATGSD